MAASAGFAKTVRAGMRVVLAGACILGGVWGLLGASGCSRSAPPPKPASTRPATLPDTSPATQASTRPQTQPASAPASTLTVDLGEGVKMKLALIPAGTFVMGSPEGGEARFDDHRPQHDATISQPFYMGVTTVTQAQWKAVMGDEPWKGKLLVQEGADCPATYISWSDTAEFCKRLSAKTGKAIHLPTEAQWEYACRAGSKTRFGYGDDPEYAALGDYAWCKTNAWDIGEKFPHPAGRKKPSAWGLYDMHGNIWQLCADWYDPNCYATADGIDPAGPPAGKDRAMRGGCWNSPPQYCQAAYRNYCAPDFRGADVGFRVVADAPPQPPTLPAGPAKFISLDLGDKLTMKLRYIPADTFLMGSPEKEPGHQPMALR